MPKVLYLISGRKQTVDWLKTSDDATLVTSVIAYSSPLPSQMTEKHERDHCKHTVHAKLKLIEEVDILQDDTAGKPATVSYKITTYDLKIYYLS